MLFAIDISYIWLTLTSPGRVEEEINKISPHLTPKTSAHERLDCQFSLLWNLSPSPPLPGGPAAPATPPLTMFMWQLAKILTSDLLASAYFWIVFYEICLNTMPPGYCNNKHGEKTAYFDSLGIHDRVFIHEMGRIQRGKKPPENPPETKFWFYDISKLHILGLLPV